MQNWTGYRFLQYKFCRINFADGSNLNEYPIIMLHHFKQAIVAERATQASKAVVQSHGS